MSRLIYCLAISALLPAFALAATEKPTTAEGWRALARTDLAAAEQLLRAHTPIPFDDENPALKRWLVQGYADAQARVAEIQGEADWYYTLSAFASGFRDPHVNIQPTGSLPPARWPGIIVAMQGDVGVVAERDASDTEAPPLGARILSCDGKPLAELMETRVLSLTLNPAFAADRRRAMTRLFIDRGIAFAPAPKRCRIEVAQEVKDVELKWRALPKPEEAWWAQLQNAAIGPAATFGVSEPAPGVTWIGVPTFSSGAQTAPKLELLIAEVLKRGDAIRASRAIVIDTRGNGGGNSQWADKLAEAIFTAPVLAKHQPPPVKSAVDWRGSEGNADYWRAWSARMREEFGVFSGSWLRAVAISDRLREAAAKSVPFYRDGSDETGPSGGQSKRRPNGDSPFAAKVYVLSNGACASSCLNFADRVLFVPGVQLIGLDTYGDGMLMDVRSETLPSGLARIVLPQKVARGRGRGALEVYAADVRYDGAWDDASVRAWVMGLANGGAR